MADDATGTGQAPQRLRPTPHGRAVEATHPTTPRSAANGDGTPDRATGAAAPNTAGPRQQLIRVDQVQPSELVAAAGNAVVTAARLGRLLTRTSWRLARQLPGGETVEREFQRAGGIAAKVLEVPTGGALTPRPRPRPTSPSTPEEQRAALLVQSAGEAPLREAMQELLQRSVEADRTSSREYLFGTIMSQLVPDEARILAALSDGTAHAACDVLVRRRRQPDHPLLTNASTIGRAAGVTTPDNVPTYLSRLQSLGLIEFGPEDEKLSTQYEILAADEAVRAARASVARGRRNPSRIVRKTVRLSALGREFWQAADPSRPALTSG